MDTRLPTYGQDPFSLHLRRKFVPHNQPLLHIRGGSRDISLDDADEISTFFGWESFTCHSAFVYYEHVDHIPAARYDRLMLADGIIFTSVSLRRARQRQVVYEYENNQGRFEVAAQLVFIPRGYEVNLSYAPRMHQKLYLAHITVEHATHDYHVTPSREDVYWVADAPGVTSEAILDAFGPNRGEWTCRKTRAHFVVASQAHRDFDYTRMDTEMKIATEDAFQPRLFSTRYGVYPHIFAKVAEWNHTAFLSLFPSFDVYLIQHTSRT